MSKNKLSFGILGTGKALPKKAWTNDDFRKFGLDTDDEWIRSRTGIVKRYIANKETTSELAIKASKEAIQDANLEPNDIDLIVVGTTTPDYATFPSVACLVQNGLDIKNTAAFDISAACTGFVCGFDIAAQMMQSGNYKNALVIGSDTLSKVCNWEDRSTVVLFGDGAGAVVLGKVSSGYGALTSKLGAKGQGYESLIVPVGGSKESINEKNVNSPDRYIQMDGKAIYRFAVNIIVKVVEEALSDCGLVKEDISFFIPHQANKRIIDFARDRLGLSEDEVYVNIDSYGNTSAASIPIAIDEANKKGLLKKGDILVTVGFGAGLTYGANVIKWG